MDKHFTIDCITIRPPKFSFVALHYPQRLTRMNCYCVVNGCSNPLKF